MGTAFILYDHPLFAEGLERLVNKECGSQVVGVAQRSDEAIERINALQPDVVLIETGKEEAGSAGVLFELLRERSMARVAEVSLENGSFTLYAGRRWSGSEAKVLMEAIFDPAAFQIVGGPNTAEFPN